MGAAIATGLIASQVPGVKEALGDTLKGFAGQGFNYDNVKEAFDFHKNALQSQVQELAKQQLAGQIDEESFNKAVNSFRDGTASAASIAKSIRGYNYGAESGLNNITPPSQLMKISDPNTKVMMQMAGGSKTMRNSINMHLANMDTSSVGIFGPPAKAALPSENINSAGGETGPQNSSDQNDVGNQNSPHSETGMSPAQPAPQPQPSSTAPVLPSMNKLALGSHPPN